MLALALCTLLAADSPKVLDPSLRITLFADAPQIVTPTGIAVDPKGRVLCIESHTHFRPDGYKGPTADRIQRFEDTDGDGKADQVVTIFEGSKHTMAMAFGPGQKLYVATRNEVFTIDYADGETPIQAKTTLVRLETPGNYPHNGLSGVTFDFDGTLYFGLGENLGADYTLIGPDGTTLKGGGEGGNIYRCRPDGSKLEKVATGFWNPFAMTFDASGRLFAVDNDPDSRPPCRLLHIVEHGDYGYRFRNGRKGLHPFTSWNGELPGTLPMMAGTGEAPSGIVAYESDQFPGFRGDLLVTSWGDHRIDRFRPIASPKNTTLTASAAPIISGGNEFRPVGIVVAPDGSLYISDWVSQSYDLHGKGRIWHITASNPPVRDDAKLGLNHPDRTIRENSAQALAVKDESGRVELRKIMASPDSTSRTRISALHALVAAGFNGFATQIAAGKLTETIELIEAIRILPRSVLDRIEFEKLIGSPAVYAAGLAKGYGGVSHPPSPDSKDPFYDHAERMKFKKNLDVPGLIDWFRGTNSRDWRLQTLLLLRDSSDPRTREVIPKALKDPDPEIRFVAIQWIGEQKLVTYRDALVGSLGEGSLTNRLFEGTLAAIDRLDGARPDAPDTGGAESLVAKLVTDRTTPIAARRRALRILRPDHPVLTAPLFDDLLASPDDELRLEAVRTLRESKLADRSDRLLQIARDEKQPDAIRAEAVTGLSGATEPERDIIRTLALCDHESIARQAARSARGLPISKALAERNPGRIVALPDGAGFEVKRTVTGAAHVALGTGLSAKDVAAKLKALESSEGDAQEGERIFYHPKGPGCYKCHRVDGRGGRIGPDLTATGPETHPEKLLRSIVEPDSEISPQFTTWRVARSDGTQVDGVLVEEAVNGDQTYADGEGKTVVIKASDLSERKPLTTSVMPRDLASTITPSELRDLIAFVHRGRIPADNALTQDERATGWELLFDGKTLNGWTTDTRAASKTPIQKAAINPHGSGGYMMIHEKEWGDFVLSLDFKLSEGCNTGVFVRTSPLEPRPGKDVGFNGIEIAIDDELLIVGGKERTLGFHDTGAIYDLVRPTHDALRHFGQWNHMEITCDGPKIIVELNGEIVSRMNLDEWTQKNARPDGSKHKFDIAYKDHPRKGYIGLQDHGGDCWYKNIKIRELRK